MGTKLNAFLSRFTKSHTRISHGGSARFSSSLIASPYARRLRLEQLEDRRMLAVLTVQNDLDDTLANLAGDSQLSLREAVEIANNQGLVIDGFSSGDGGDTIEFVPALSGSTISLTDGELLVTEELSIDATPLSANVTIDAQLQSRIFHITANTVDYTLAGLTLTGGRTVANGQSGGAIKFTGNGSLTLDQSIVSGNSTLGQSSQGGGIFSNGSLTLTQSTVSGNSTAGSFAAGGGIASNGAVTLTQSTISGNSTSGLNSSPGGGIIAGSGGITLTQSTVSGNSTSGVRGGGGIYSGGPVTLKHSTITDNHASYSNALTTGGGISNFANPVIITHSIVAGNTSGGGSDDLDPGTGTLTVKFSLIGDNDGTGLTEAQTPDANGNLIGSSAGSGIIDPLLGPLANNGGPTNAHAPLTGSPAIDAGNSSFSTPPDFDQRGAPFVRVFDGGVGGLRIDIGAYELQTVLGLNMAVDTAIDELDGDHSAGNLSLREAIVLADGNLGADVITFDAGVFNTPQTILLTLGELQINETVNIDAVAVATLTIDAQQNSRVINFTPTAGDLTLSGLTLTGGRTIADGFLERGGAIRFRSTDSLIILESNVSGNSTAGFGADGGGIYSLGSLRLTQSTVSGNSTGGNSADGGGIFSLGDITLTQSTVSGNSTVGDNADGGGIKSDGAVTLTQSTVSGNSTAGMNADGGGIAQYFSNITLTHSTVTDNHANHSSSTGGGFKTSSLNSDASISHSIIAGNTAGGVGDDISLGAGAFSADFSLIGDNDGTGLTEAQTPDANGNLIGSAAGSGIIDPLLGPLANNGGPTKTHAPQTGSPVIDAGDPSFVGPPDFDQRTTPFVRVFDGGVGGLRIDIGAFERQTLPASSLVVDITDDENDGDFSLGDLSLREAIFLANNASFGADTITFDTGVFSTPQAILLTLSELEISETVTIDATSVAEVTINAQQNSRVLNFTDSTGDLTLDGLTITGGETTANNEAGGGIRFLSDGALTLTNSTISGNDSADDGGGIYTVSGNVTLNSSTVSGNSTTGSAAIGGGIFTFYGDVALNDSTVSGNSTTGNSAAVGGGIATFSGAVTLTNSSVSGNVSSSNGGGIFTYSGEVTLANSTINGNSAINGGGLYNQSGTVNVTDSTISGNSATSDGGGIHQRDTSTITGSTISDNSAVRGGGIFFPVDATANINSSTISGNTASSKGGGIFNFGTATISSSTISSNSATADGGGIYNFVTTNITNSTISENSTSGDGGGIYNSVVAATTLDNAIVAENTAGTSGPDIDSSFGSVNGSFNLIGDGTGQTGLVNDTDGNLVGTSGSPINPLLGSLADNGGPTQTHALLTGSPAIDAGDSSIVFNPAEFDQRLDGFFRVIDGDGLAGARMDIGAFELQAASSADFDDDGIIDGFDFLAWQRGFGTQAPNATKTDGDADNDLDVDSDDLGIWESQFGTVAPAIAATGASIPTESVAQQPIAHNDLVDVALAVALVKEAGGAVGEEAVVEHSPLIEFFPTQQSRRDPSGPSSIYRARNTRLEDPQESSSSESTSSWEDAFDEVFASVFQ